MPPFIVKIFRCTKKTNPKTGSPVANLFQLRKRDSVSCFSLLETAAFTHVILPHDPAPPTWVSSLFSTEGELAGVFHSHGVIHLHKVPKAQRDKTSLAANVLR